MSDLVFRSETSGIEVRVRPNFLPEESRPAANRFVWAYEVEIENGSPEVWQLTHRCWDIIDALGRQQNVEGEGVVGQTPVLNPGDVFRYTSGVPLSAPSGMMGGKYTMLGRNGETMDIKIPTFSLDSPYNKERPV